MKVNALCFVQAIQSAHQIGLEVRVLGFELVQLCLNFSFLISLFSFTNFQNSVKELQDFHFKFHSFYEYAGLTSHLLKFRCTITTYLHYAISALLIFDEIDLLFLKLMITVNGDFSALQFLLLYHHLLGSNFLPLHLL